ncbi:MAG: HDOD domain-containing protein [Rhodocyclaceae bacterium]|nr:HDOD domain-containing protein [Rhodocyclaceae bacterium]
MLEMEAGAFALNHAQLTVAMLLDWGLPKALAELVLFHEWPERCTYEEGSRNYRFAHFLTLAEYVADVCGAPENEWRAMMPMLLLMGSRLSIDAETLMHCATKRFVNGRSGASC